MKRQKILLADPHDVVIEGLRRILDRPELEITGVVNEGHALVRAAVQTHPDLIISEVSLTSLNGIAAVRQIRNANRSVKIIFLTMHADVMLAAEALAAGASGYVLKTNARDELLPAIQEVMAGRRFIAKSIAEVVTRRLSTQSGATVSSSGTLTPRQDEVLQLLAEGCTAKEIAFRLHLSSRTVEFHKYRIMAELGLRSVAELSRYAATQKIIIALPSDHQSRLCGTAAI
jgi:DNA-binding NarL/FixJ family response regulator